MQKKNKLLQQDFTNEGNNNRLGVLQQKLNDYELQLKMNKNKVSIISEDQANLMASELRIKLILGLINLENVFISEMFNPQIVF